MGKSDEKTLAKDLINSLMDDVSKMQDTSKKNPSKGLSYEEDPAEGTAKAMWDKLKTSVKPEKSEKPSIHQGPKIPLMNPNLFGKEFPLGSKIPGDETTVNKSERSHFSTPQPAETIGPKLSDEKVAEVMKSDDRTMELERSALEKVGKSATKNDETVSVAVPNIKQKFETQKTKVAFGSPRGTMRPSSGTDQPPLVGSSEASLAQAENLRFAQQRILELEEDIEKTRFENDELAVAGQVLRSKNEELKSYIAQLEEIKREAEESAHRELEVLQQNIAFKNKESQEYKEKIEELEYRISQDFKKVRVRERELENRLELTKIEKAALVRSKDETILDLKRKVDQLTAEAESYRLKCQEINKQVELQQDQVRRTVRALRLALGNLEVSDKDDVVAFKKAE